MKKYEFKIEILNEDYADQLIVSLCRQGYNPYLSPDNEVCISITENELEEINECSNFLNN